MANYNRFCPRCGSTNIGSGLPLGKFKYEVGVEQSYSCKSCGYSQINRFPETTLNQLKKIKKLTKNKQHKKLVDSIPTLPYETFMKFKWYRILSGIVLILFIFFIILEIVMLIR